MGELGQRQAAQQGGRCGKELFSLLMSSAVISLFMHLSTKKIVLGRNASATTHWRKKKQQRTKTQLSKLQPVDNTITCHSVHNTTARIHCMNHCN